MIIISINHKLLLDFLGNLVRIIKEVMIEENEVIFVNIWMITNLDILIS